jgi:hypothetical protein
MSAFSLALVSQDFVSLITTLIDLLAISVIAISIIQAIAPLTKVMTRGLMTAVGSFYYHERQLQDQKSLYRHEGQIAKKNLIRGLLFALELESANAILKMGVFTSFLTGALPLADSSANTVNNFIFFIAVLSVRIGINWGLRRFNRNA